tara:strand:- start:426 stop:620 length:195 start_codon:yes stop_codon:yes gene_type:complete
MNNFEEWWETYDPSSYELMTDDMKKAFESGYNIALDDLVNDGTSVYDNRVSMEKEDVLARKIVV